LSLTIALRVASVTSVSLKRAASCSKSNMAV
jgi:hypothetical protein